MRTLAVAIALVGVVACSPERLDDGRGTTSSSGGGGGGGGGGSQPTTWLRDPTTWLRFLAVDNGSGKLALVDTRGTMEWTVDIPGGSRDVARIGDSDALISHSAGAQRVSLADGALVWSVDGFSNVQSAEPLANGNVVLATQDGADVVLTEVDTGGAVVGEPVRAPGYEDLRLARRLPDGNTLFTAGGPYRVVEVDPTGAEVWSAPLPGKGYVAVRDDAGKTIATTGDDVRVVALDAAGDIERAWGGRDEHADVPLEWFSGFDRVSDDVVVVANWLGHGAWGTAPHVVVFGANNELLMTWEDHERLKVVTNVLVLDGVLTPP